LTKIIGVPRYLEMHSRYKAFHDEIKRQFGEKIFRVTVNAGMTCPNIDGTRAKGGCTFCQDASYLGASFEKGATVSQQIEQGMSYVGRRHGTEKFFVYFQNGTNTHAPVEVLRKLFDEALSFPNVAGLFIATRPDSLGNEVLDLLEEINSKTYLWIELGLQSHRNDILAAINRAHTVEEFEDGVRLLHQRKIRVGAHVILGLPQETDEDTIQKALTINRLPLEGIKIHNLVVFRKTVLEKQYHEGKYTPLSLEHYSKLCVDFLEHLRPDILIERLNAHGPREQTVAPEWSINKFLALNAVHAELEKRDTWQGKKYFCI